MMDPPPPIAAAKIRLMVSYGGHIVPVLHKLKSLFYAGGDTRIISVPASSAATVSAFSSHIATVLQVGYSFSLKYQLPLHDLDSLISLSSDEDLFIFLEELHRVSSSPDAPSRIRLFLIPVKQQVGDHELAVSGSGAELTQPWLTRPKTESWFVDALKSARMMQQKREMGSFGFGGEGGQSDGLCGQESMMLETTSSFGSSGSSSSSVSLPNLPAIKSCGDETVIHYQDNKSLLPSTESTTSDIGSMASAVSHAQTVTSQDPVIPVVTMENKVSLNPIELSDSKIPDLVPGVPVHRTVHVAGYPLSTQLDQHQQQPLQFVQMGNPVSVLPVSSYYPTYNMLSPHQPLQYISNQPYPVYFVPVGQAQAYNASPQYCSKETMPVVSGRPPLHPNTSVISPHVAYKEVTACPPIPGFVSQVYSPPVANSPVHIPCNENKQQNLVVPHMHNQPAPISATSRETANYSNEHDDDAALTQIYKSQPPPPALPSQYKTMTNATTVLLSEALAQLHMDNIKQPVKTSQPQ